MVGFDVCAAVTIISALVSLGFSVVAVGRGTGRERVNALYAAGRSVAFAIVSVVALLNGSIGWLEASAVGMIVVQLCDAAVGVHVRDKVKTFGPAGTAIMNMCALGWLLFAGD
jgi:hypothetical protein